MMEQAIVRMVGALGGGTVAFYVLGYTIVQSYTYKLELEGMFWLTSEFYTDAGARFLLEAIRAPLLVPHVFVPYALLLMYGVIGRKRPPHGSSASEGVSLRRRWVKLAWLVGIAAMTYVAVLFYGEFVVRSPLRDLLYYAIPNPVSARAPRATPVERSLMFFNIVTPVAVVFGVFLYRRRELLGGDAISRFTYQLTALSSVVLMAIVPIAYGFYIYDWKIVRIEDSGFLRTGGADGKGSDDANVWFLGRFGDKYVFLRDRGSRLEGRIETLDQQEIKRLHFDLKRSGFLRDQLERGIVEVNAQELTKVLRLEGGQQ